MRGRLPTSAFAVMLGMIGLTLCHPPTPTVAKVEVMTGAAVMADEETVKEIVATFERAEKAIQAKDLDGLMTLYSKRYNYHKLRKSDARRIWEEIFEYHHGLHSTHLFSKVTKVVQTSGEVTAQVTCTGALWGLVDETGKKVTVDSWFEEVHFLVKEDGAWRIIGNEGSAPETPRFGHAPHPLF